MPNLSMSETAARFGVSRQRVFVWIREGRLKATWEDGVAGPQRGRYLISATARKPKPIRPVSRKEPRSAK